APAAVGVLDRAEEGEVIEPGRVMAAEGFEGRTTGRAALIESRKSFAQAARAKRDTRIEIVRIGAQARVGFEIGGLEQALFAQRFEAHQPRAAGMGGKGAIGAVPGPVARRA